MRGQLGSLQELVSERSNSHDLCYVKAGTGKLYDQAQRAPHQLTGCLSKMLLALSERVFQGAPGDQNGSHGRRCGSQTAAKRRNRD